MLELSQRVADRMARHDTFDVTDAAKRITSDVGAPALWGGPWGSELGVSGICHPQAERLNQHLWLIRLHSTVSSYISRAEARLTC